MDNLLKVICEIRHPMGLRHPVSETLWAPDVIVSLKGCARCWWLRPSSHCNTLQKHPAHCNTLHTAKHCNNTLHRTAPHSTTAFTKQLQYWHQTKWYLQSFGNPLARPRRSNRRMCAPPTALWFAALPRLSSSLSPAYTNEEIRVESLIFSWQQCSMA